MTTTSAPTEASAHRGIETVLTVRDLTRRYAARQVLDGVTFEVNRVEIFGILGRNGTGKTTTMEILQGLRTRDGGQVSLLGIDPEHDRRRLRGLVGSQLQSSQLPERIKVAEALRLFARLADNVVDWRQLRDEWGLTRVSNSAFGSLSGGERQRLFIALALVNRPQVVLLDELTQGLDPAARRTTWQLIRRVREKGASVLLVTHDMVEAEHLCDRIAVLDQGRIHACGTPAELIASVGGPVHTTFSAEAEMLDGLDALPGVLEVTHDGRRAGVHGDAASSVLIAAELARRGCLPIDYAIQRPSLDEVFLTMTGAVR
jgi:ABC-2 type transport system ATP-binding protein